MMKNKQIKITRAAGLAASMVLAGGASAIAQPSQPGAAASIDEVAGYFGTTAADLTTNPTSILNQFMYGDTNKLNAVYALAKPTGLYSNDLAGARSSFAYAAGNKMSPDQFMQMAALPGAQAMRSGDPIANTEFLKAFRSTPQSYVASAYGVSAAHLNSKQAQTLGKEYFQQAGMAYQNFVNTVYTNNLSGLLVSTNPAVAIPGYSATAGTNYVPAQVLGTNSQAALAQAVNAFSKANDLAATKIAAGSAENPSNLRMNRTVMGMLTAPASSGQAEGGFFSNFGLNGGLFYNHSELDNDIGAIQTFGTEIGGSMGGDRFLASVTVPLYYTWMPKAWGDSFAYGVDVAASYEVLKGLRLGVNGNIINNDTDMFNSRFSWQVGPTVSYGIAINDRFHVNLGTIFNYGGIESGEETWMSGYGIGLGVKLTDKMTLTPYYAYYRDLDALSGFDPDWHDVGLQLNAQINPKWSFAGGVKSSLGEHLGTIKVDYNINVYLSTCYKF